KLSEIHAAIQGMEMGLVEPILVGEEDKLPDNLPDGVQVVPADSDTDAVEKAVKLVSSGEADILMKGSVPTSMFLKGVLNKEWGLRGKGVLSHVALLDIPEYHKLLIITDGGMCIKPDLKTKISILKNAVEFAHSIGVENPKVGILAAVEVVNQDMIETVDASIISKMASRGQINGAIVDGPLAMDILISKEAAEIKGVSSPVAGDVDIILVPDITTGNSVAKALLYLANGKAAGAVVGTSRPVVMLSRADSPETKLNSLILGILCS
ncbi:bifunctional enoyl-CoA hydratase/phosphate acetyltransferase, partial [candidate division WOR-3 bacterium]|nr:bifunctional enoyl-CoA hydratase/phosphate acetyltransferase [candidate division WOR-3 bacterium]